MPLYRRVKLEDQKGRENDVLKRKLVSMLSPEGKSRKVEKQTLCYVIFVVFLSCSISFSPLLAAAQETQVEQPEPADKSGKIVPFVPTPPEVVERMLELAKVDRHDTVYDLGSGDGRIVIMAAQKFGARAVGVELDDELFQKSSARIAELGLEKRAKIMHGNFLDADVRPATVVTLYLLTSVNEQVRPLLEKQLRPGTRVVSHDFEMHGQGWEPKKVERMTLENGIEHTIYLYVRP